MDTALSPPVGQLLGGRYHVGSRIARGGMATVYLGTDTRLDRVVALKIAHLELSDDAEFVRRFIGEARSVARLSSPNVVGVYDQGTDGPLHYIAMEYVAGRTLRQLLIERGRLNAREALDIMTGVLSGLAAAHQAGIAHRDVKPENVLLTPAGEVKVADFGLARSVAGAVQTRGGMIIGTAGYLAPEQVSGGGSDARTDVYAAGIMLFELLTGKQPHTGDSPLAVAYKHVNEVVPAPSAVLPGVSPALDALVAMATSRDPNLRPANAGQFLRAIDEVRNGQHVAGSAPYRARPHAAPADADRLGRAPYGQDSHDQDASQNPYGQNPYGQNPYGQDSYSENPGSQSGYAAGPYSPHPYQPEPASADSRAPGIYGPDPHSAGSHSAGSHSADPYSSGSYGSGTYDSGAYRSDLYGSGPHSMGHQHQGPHVTSQYNSSQHNSGQNDGGRYPDRGAIGASALPSLSPQSAAMVPAPTPDLSEAVNHTLVVPTGAGFDDYRGYSGRRYDDSDYDSLYRGGYRGHRAVGHQPEPLLQRLLFGKRLWFVLGGVVVVVAIGLTTWWLSAGQYTKVPALRGMTRAAASAKLDALGLTMRVGQSRHSDLPKGEVLAMSPAPGSSVGNGSQITLTLSLGPAMVQVPDVTGQPLSQAEDALRQAHLKPGTVRKATSGTVPVGDVITTNPVAYSTWPQTKPVGLTISAGPGLGNFIGQPLQTAQAAAQSGGFTINAVPDIKSSQPAGTITGQSPPPNTPIKPGEVVTVRVSQGPPTVDVPNVVGMPVREAIKVMEQAGFQVTVNAEGPGDRVGSYSPTTPQPKGSTITLNIGLLSGL
ncbi:MAG TPA: PASTA domain-containing protein [Streptosporangiaceae bacterium]|nr:PASTA domain-containing protein [Streptosporangiaceae bacterium]